MSKYRREPPSFGSSSKQVSNDEIMAIVDPQRNTGLRKFIGLTSYGGLASLLLVFYMDINESDLSYLIRRFFMGALGFPSLRMLMQLVYYCATKSHANNLYVSGGAGFLTGLWLGNSLSADYGQRRSAWLILPAAAFAAGAIIVESCL